MAHLEKDVNGKFFISDPWHVEDVQSIRPDLSDDEAENVLEVVADNFDANYGINWDVLTYWADELYPMDEEDDDVE
jgi:hypothetical protein